MGVTILSLPPELHSQIFSQLNPFDLEAVAKTFNQILHHRAMPLLAPHASWIRNARRMCARFPPKGDLSLMPSFPGHIGPFQEGWTDQRDQLASSDCERLALPSAQGPLIRCSPPDLRSWLRMDGTLSWLEPLDEHMARRVYPYTGGEGDRAVASDHRVNAIVEYAKRFGLTLPPGFETFLRSKSLHHRIPSTSAWYFEVPAVTRCPPAVDKGAGGHILRFHSDQQYCAFAYLYMDTSGNHCVLCSMDDLFERHMRHAEGDEAGPDDWIRDTHAEEEGEEGHRALEFHMVGLTFEEYLATTYFEELLNYKAKPFRGLVDFAAHVYRSPAAVEHMRGSNQAIDDFFKAQNRWRKDH